MPTRLPGSPKARIAAARPITAGGALLRNGAVVRVPAHMSEARCRVASQRMRPEVAVVACAALLAVLLAACGGSGGRRSGAGGTTSTTKTTGAAKAGPFVLQASVGARLPAPVSRAVVV